MKHNKGTWVFCVTFTTRRGNFPLCYDINSSVVKYRWLWENWRDLSLKRDVASSFHLCYHYFTFLNVIKTRASVAIRLCNIFTVATIVHMKTNGWKILLLQCTKDAVEKIQTHTQHENRLWSLEVSPFLNVLQSCNYDLLHHLKDLKYPKTPPI